MEKPKLIQGGTTQQEKTVKPSEQIKIEPKNQTTQREAVYIEVTLLIKDEKLIFTPKQAVKSVLTETQIKRICVNLAKGFQSKKIALKETESNKRKLNDAKSMEIYCLGLLNNWLRRDKRLNGSSN